MVWPSYFSTYILASQHCFVFIADVLSVLEGREIEYTQGKSISNSDTIERDMIVV